MFGSISDSINSYRVRNISITKKQDEEKDRIPDKCSWLHRAVGWRQSAQFSLETVARPAAT
jgi:hypothetical protein